ncbi:MAG: hypothetical protein N2449_02220 [Bacteroidales bacterium]|nr:hypothetical protein [Bacteroidales bacterium]
MVKCYIILFLLITLCSCNIEEDCDYSDCLPYEPYESEMYIQTTIDKNNDSIPIWIYEGKYDEDNQLIFVDTVTKDNYFIILPLNHYYFVKAKYIKNNKIVYAIDGVYFKKYKRNECDSTCWTVKNKTLDVQLKK